MRIARAGGDPARVRIVGVTKGFGPEVVRAAREAGIRDLGENYAAELLAKSGAAQLYEGGAGPGVWHFLGAIQRNKVPALAPVVSVWQSVAREAEGARIARFAPGASVMVQVDVTGLPGRNGCTPNAVPDLVKKLQELGLVVLGLMTVAAPEPAAAEVAFSRVVGLADQLGLPERSLGMSDDLETAIAAGSTMVRIGRALFGDRPPPTSSWTPPLSAPGLG